MASLSKYLRRLTKYMREFDSVVEEYRIPKDVADLAKSYYTHVLTMHWEDVRDYVRRTRRNLAIACILIASDELGAPITIKRFRRMQRYANRLANRVRELLGVDGTLDLEKHVRYLSNRIGFDDELTGEAIRIAKDVESLGAPYYVAIYAVYRVARDRLGMSARSIAERFELPTQTVSYIVRRLESKRYKRGEANNEYAEKRGWGKE